MASFFFFTSTELIGFTCLCRFSQSPFHPFCNHETWSDRLYSHNQGDMFSWCGSHIWCCSHWSCCIIFCSPLYCDHFCCSVLKSVIDYYAGRPLCLPDWILLLETIGPMLLGLQLPSASHSHPDLHQREVLQPHHRKFSPLPELQLFIFSFPYLVSLTSIASEMSFLNSFLQVSLIRTPISPAEEISQSGEINFKIWTYS